MRWAGDILCVPTVANPPVYADSFHKAPSLSVGHSFPRLTRPWVASIVWRLHRRWPLLPTHLKLCSPRYAGKEQRFRPVGYRDDNLSGNTRRFSTPRLVTLNGMKKDVELQLHTSHTVQKRCHFSFEQSLASSKCRLYVCICTHRV